MRYNKDACAIEMSALELCAYASRKGNLDTPQIFYDSSEYNEQELYYRLQAEAGSYYNTDVELSNTLSLSGIYFTVSIKADGVVRREGHTQIDKIKCVKGRAFMLPPDDFTLAMLKCSAYFLCVRDSLSEIWGRVDYYNTETKKIKYFKYKFSIESLKEFYISMLSKTEYRARLIMERELEDLPSAENAKFPYSHLREGQEQMIKECYSAIRRGKRLFAEAPTGTGKTISALFPAIRALGRGYCDKIFYLTPKTATRKEAFAAAAKLYAGGVRQRTVVVSAKEQMCICPAKAQGIKNCCDSKICEYARGYYDRVDAALCEMLSSYRGYSRGLILDVAKKYKICPYELSLDLSELCDVIICDYNYAFDPLVYFRRYFGANCERKNEKYVFLIDEVHNLTDRAREMYSSELCMSMFADAKAQFSLEPIYGEECKKLVEPIINAFLGIKKLCRDNIVRDEDGNERGFYIDSRPIEPLGRALEMFRKQSDAWISKNREHYFADILFSLSMQIKKYITVAEYFDNNFKTYAEIENRDIRVKLYCHDPSEIMSNLLQRASSSIMFSATLAPPEYFCDVLGGGKNAESIKLNSPFEGENLLVTVAKYINTRFEDREDNARKFATLIAATLSARAGNYIAYFPSYKCLEQTHKEFKEKYPKVETIVQKQYMNSSEREGFLSAFKNDTGHLRVGFCVLGGMFSEGVDLPGSRLIGCIIFGVGLPGLSTEKNIIKEHFDLKSEDGMGYDYAYTFPGMNNVLQAAGRVIRTENDRGVVVLADDRYTTQKYQSLFPSSWCEIKYAENASSAAQIIRDFWLKGQ